MFIPRYEMFFYFVLILHLEGTPLLWLKWMRRGRDHLQVCLFTRHRYGPLTATLAQCKHIQYTQIE
jgi:hypothetical protein